MNQNQELKKVYISFPENDTVKSLPTSSSTSTLVPEIIDDTVNGAARKVLKVNISKNPKKNSESKKREDLTSLGSDDSGRI